MMEITEVKESTVLLKHYTLRFQVNYTANLPSTQLDPAIAIQGNHGIY